MDREQAVRTVLQIAVMLLAPVLPATWVYADGEPAAQPAAREGMSVKVANRQIIVLRGPIAGLTARERATNTMSRIDEALEADPHAAVTMEDVPEGTRVLVGGKHAFLVTKVDIDALAGETTQMVAKLSVQRLEQAIVERREEEKPRYLAIAAAYALTATLLYGVLLWLVFGINRWIGHRLSLRAASHSKKLQLGGLSLLDAGRVLTFTRRLLAVAAWVVATMLTSAWLSFVLVRFPYTRPWGEELEHRLLEIAREILLAVAGALPGLLLAVVIFVIARALVGSTTLFFEKVALGTRKVGWLDADTAKPTQRIVSFIVWVFALAIAYPYLPGAQTDAFKGLSVLLGLMASMGAASVVGQAFNGFILMYSRAYRRGDFVRIGEVEGTVESLGTFVTSIRTGLGEHLTVPNSVVMGGLVRNYSRSAPGGGCIIHTTVTIGYSTPWRQVHAMLEEAARRVEDISPVPAPRVRQLALSDFYVEYRLIAHSLAADAAHRADVLNRLHGSIQDVFYEYNVQILSPHYMMDPKEPQIVPRDRWHAPPAKAPGKN